MNALHTVTVHGTLQILALRAIALFLAFGATTCFSARLDPTEEDKAPEPRAGASFGAAVAISGDTVMVGMPTHNQVLGRVGVYTRKAEGWVRTATIPNPKPDSEQSELFGRDLDLGGHSVVVDAHNEAYLFRKQGKRWDLIGAFGRSDPITTLGSSVAYSNGFMARSIQAYRINEDESQSELPGVVRVYEQCKRAIRRVATLRASDAAPTDRFGVSLAMDRGVLVVGAPGVGAAYVFVRDGNQWVQRQKLVSSDGGVGDFGTSVAIRNGMILVGAPGVDVPDWREGEMTSPEGKVYAFLPSRRGWYESQQLNNDGQFYLAFGTNVALSRDLAVAVSPINVPASWSRSTVIAFDRVSAHLTSVAGGMSTGDDGSRVIDVDASKRGFIVGVQESMNWGGPTSGWVEVVELPAEGTDASANLDAASTAAH